MSKGKHGNKEAKKPKQAAAPKAPVAAAPLPATSGGARSTASKR